jgi:hypothetical protein
MVSHCHAANGTIADFRYPPQTVSTTSGRLTTTTAVPDTDSNALNGLLTAERAGVLGVLGHLDLLHLLTQGSTIPGAVLTDDADLLRALGLQNGWWSTYKPGNGGLEDWLASIPS